MSIDHTPLHSQELGIMCAPTPTVHTSLMSRVRSLVITVIRDYRQSQVPCDIPLRMADEVMDGHRANITTLRIDVPLTMADERRHSKMLMQLVEDTFPPELSFDPTVRIYFLQRGGYMMGG